MQIKVLSNKDYILQFVERASVFYMWEIAVYLDIRHLFVC